MHRDTQDSHSAPGCSREFREQERCYERECRLIYSFYPDTARMIQPRVTEECDRLNYPGSFLFDEYPDKWMVELTCRRIRRALTDTRDCGEAMLDELIRVLLCQEMFKRRYRERHCRRYFPENH